MACMSLSFLPTWSKLCSALAAGPSWPGHAITPQVDVIPVFRHVIGPPCSHAFQALRALKRPTDRLRPATCDLRPAMQAATFSLRTQCSPQLQPRPRPRLRGCWLAPVLLFLLFLLFLVWDEMFGFPQQPCHAFQRSGCTRPFLLMDFNMLPIGAVVLPNKPLDRPPCHSSCTYSSNVRNKNRHTTVPS